MLKAVLFDLDGTLVDSSEGILNASREALASLNISGVTDEEIMSCIGPPIGESLGRFLDFNESQKREFYDVFRPLYRDRYLFQCAVYPGIESLIKELKGRGLSAGVVTNKKKDSTSLLLDRLGMADLFDVVIAQDDVVRDKSLMITEALDSLNIDRRETIMVGDSLNDLDAATKAGVDFIGVSYGFGLKEHLDNNVIIVDTVDELRNSLLR